MENQPKGKSDENKGAQVSLKRTQAKKGKGSHNSLSTIAEELKSLPTDSSVTEIHGFRNSFTSSTDLLTEDDEKPKKKLPFPLPKLPTTLPCREKRHTSVALRGTSQELILHHEREKNRKTQEELLYHLTVTGRPLFRTVVQDENVRRVSPSILVTGFGLRNLESLQEALEVNEHNKLKQIYGIHKMEEETSTETAGSLLSHAKTESSSATQTDTCSVDVCGETRKLMYMMGIRGRDAEEGVSTAEEVVAEVDPDNGATIAMRRAQKYLRVHKIFEFFQFLIAHLLSALPENPIEFIIELIDKCLLYRSGLIEPPLLYTRNHLQCLFYLIDKMRTGYIEVEEYKIAMNTVGVCLYNENPPLSRDKMVARDYFIEEAYDCLTNILNDMIKRRYLNTNPLTPPTTPCPPPPSPQMSALFNSSTGELTMASTNRFTKSRLFLDCVEIEK